MDNEFKNEPFLTLKMKRSVVKRFRRFCRVTGTSQSLGMSDMLDFFERHKVLPKDEIPNHLLQVEKRLLRRINAVIAIMKDVEKTQTKPTVGMLEALFTMEDKKEDAPRFVEKKQNNRTLEEELENWKRSNE